VKKLPISDILRGLRNPGDFEFEKQLQYTNRDLEVTIETRLC
jgi:phosphopantetheine adenylyltransferase